MNETAEFYEVDEIYFDWEIGLRTGHVLCKTSKEIVPMARIPKRLPINMQTEPFVKLMICGDKFCCYVPVAWSAQDEGSIDDAAMEDKLKQMIQEIKEGSLSIYEW